MNAASPTWYSLKGIISKMQSLLVLQMPPSDAERQNILFLYQCWQIQNSLNFTRYPVPRSCFSNTRFFTPVIYRKNRKLLTEISFGLFKIPCSILGSETEINIFPFGIHNIIPLSFLFDSKLYLLSWFFLCDTFFFAAI